MINEFTIKVQSTIRTYIDAIGESKIAARTQDKLDFLHKDLVAQIYEKLDVYIKNNKELKIKVQLIKKKKYEKGASKDQKIEFSKQLLIELIAVMKEFDLLSEMCKEYQRLMMQVKRIRSWSIYEQWIDWALTFGDGSYLATHIAKLTHSSSKGSSIDLRYFESCRRYSDFYLCTDVRSPVDTAYPDNKYSSISQLYNTQVDGQFIGDLLRDDGEYFLSDLTDDQELLSLWVSSFSNKIKDEKKQSYFLSKQVYFPVGEKKYHLLMPLVSSSLVHAIHLEHKNRWEEPLNSAVELQGKKMYSPTPVIRYPNKAYLHVTGSNHSNASSLNGKRGGRIPLMSALPPQWTSRVPSYIDQSSIFTKTLAFELKEEVTELANYLLLLKNKELSISEPKRNAAVLSKFRAINSQFFNYLENINESENDDGWTVACKLPIEQQLLFESWREDEPAQACKINNDWLDMLSRDFGRWLNQQLNKNKNLKLTPIHAALWADCFLIDLKEVIAVKEVEL